MDENRFDSLTRAFGAGRSRRSIVKGLGKGLGAAAVAAVGLSRLSAAEAAPNDPGDPAHCCQQARQFGDYSTAAAACCSGNQVCYTCAAIARQGGEPVGSSAVAGCCTPGVDCPDDVHGHHSQFCQTFVNSLR